jgi:carboxypeptidase Q
MNCRVRRIARIALALSSVAPAAHAADADALVAALLGDTPLVRDLESLTDEVGGRPTGSAANRKAVEWGLGRFRDAGVPARREPFTMPALWLERSARASVSGDAAFAAHVVAMPFSTATPVGGSSGPLMDGGSGAEADFTRLGAAARGAFILIETKELADLEGLFKEYFDAADVEKRAFAAGASGVAYMGSRASGALYRHNASLAEKNRHPLLIMGREDAQRALRLLRAGKRLGLKVEIDLDAGGPYTAENVVAEIRGRDKPDEIVLVGAHLDSWDLGTGALDNGCNAAVVIDLARQLQALGVRPRRTVRFVLWNGEEQMMLGSWGYVKTHAAELDKHVATLTADLGSGRVVGFYTNGRKEIVPAVDKALALVAGLGPFTHVEEPVVGTDNYDFMLEGVANLVANQESANYGPNYHARSDTFDKVDLQQLRLNAAILGAAVYWLAQADVAWGRQSRSEVEALVEGTGLKSQMVSFGLYDDWLSGARGRKK